MSFDLETYLNSFTIGYKCEEMLNLETALVTSLKWNLNLVTPSDYIHFLSNGDENGNGNGLSNDDSDNNTLGPVG